MEKNEFRVKIVTQLTEEIKIMTLDEIINYLDHNFIEEVKIKKVEKNSTN